MRSAAFQLTVQRSRDGGGAGGVRGRAGLAERQRRAVPSAEVLRALRAGGEGDDGYGSPRGELHGPLFSTVWCGVQVRTGGGRV